MLVFEPVPEVRCRCTSFRLLFLIAGRVSAPSIELLAAGPSGAGKTTLLHCLAWRRVAHTRVQGNVLVAGKPRLSPAFTQKDAVLAEQDQTFTPCLTILETIDMYCRLQRPGYAGSAHGKQMDVLEMLLQLVGLHDVRHSKVESVLVFWMSKNSVRH